MGEKGKKSKYILQNLSGSICPYCKKYVYLLIGENIEKRKPAFYICFDCETVFEVGVGPVTKRIYRKECMTVTHFGSVRKIKIGEEKNDGRKKDG
jgi:hypothetical protein